MSWNELYKGVRNDWGYTGPLNGDEEIVEIPMCDNPPIRNWNESWLFERMTEEAVEKLADAEDGTFVSYYDGHVIERETGDVYQGIYAGKVIKKGNTFIGEHGPTSDACYHFVYNPEGEWGKKWMPDPEFYPHLYKDDDDWKSMWERADNGNETVRYHLMWSKDGLGEDEAFDTLAELRAAFRKECLLRLMAHKDADESANVPVVPEQFYQKYLNDEWYDYDSCCWVNKTWAGDYVPRIPTGAYFSDLNGYARNITPTGRLGQEHVKFT